MSTHTASQRRSKNPNPMAAVPLPPENTENSRATDLAAATPDPVTRNEMVSRAAYFRAERRGFAEGSALQDWLEAEAEIDAKFER